MLVSENVGEMARNRTGSMSRLKIEAGKYYRRRDLKVVGPVRNNNGGPFPFCVGDIAYFDNGNAASLSGSPTSDDLTAVVEQFWVVNQYEDIGWRTVGPDGPVVLTEDMESFGPRCCYGHEYEWVLVPDCTGFDYQIPPETAPEKTPAETQLEDLGVSLFAKSRKPYRVNLPAGLFHSVHSFTPKQLRAIADHMEETKTTA